MDNVVMFKSKEQLEIASLKREINSLRDELESLSENLTSFMTQVVEMSEMLYGSAEGGRNGARGR